MFHDLFAALGTMILGAIGLIFRPLVLLVADLCLSLRLERNESGRIHNLRQEI